MVLILQLHHSLHSGAAAACKRPGAGTLGTWHHRERLRKEEASGLAASELTSHSVPHGSSGHTSTRPSSVAACAVERSKQFSESLLVPGVPDVGSVSHCWYQGCPTSPLWEAAVSVQQCISAVASGCRCQAPLLLPLLCSLMPVACTCNVRTNFTSAEHQCRSREAVVQPLK